MRLLTLSLILQCHSTDPLQDPLEWMKGLPDTFDNDYSDHGYFSDVDLPFVFDTESHGDFISDFGENVALTHEVSPRIPVSTTTLQPPVRPLRARPTTTVAPIAHSRPRRIYAKRPLYDDSRSSSPQDGDDGEEESADPLKGSGALSRFDQGRGYALLAANPAIPKNDFIASLISSNPHLVGVRVQEFFYKCHRRTRFPKFVLDHLATHREHMRSHNRSALRAALLPLYEANGYTSASISPLDAIGVWGELALSGPPQVSYSTETSRGTEFVILSRLVQVELFTRLWRKFGSPSRPLVVEASVPPPPSSAAVLTEEDRVAALELLVKHPSMGVLDLVDAFIATHPDSPKITVKSMFKRYRGWTTAPLWMHETISRNAHLTTTKENMKLLIQLVLERAKEAGCKCPNRTADFIVAWVKYCVSAGPSVCIPEYSRGGMIVRMPGEAQKAFFQSRLEQLVEKCTESPSSRRHNKN